MSVLARVHELSDPGRLDTTAYALFGTAYRLLDDNRADQVWAAIEKGEGISPEGG